MIIVLREDQLPRAKAIMAQYGSKLTYSKVITTQGVLYAVAEGPLGALLLIRAELGDKELQRKFGLE